MMVADVASFLELHIMTCSTQCVLFLISCYNYLKSILRELDYMAVSKEQLSKLIQQLPDDALPIAADFLEKLVLDPGRRYIPWDDEPTTLEDLEEIKKANEAFSRGEGIKFKDVINELLY
jgi:hypothetical protein